MNVSICIATHRRAERLRALLDDLSNQTLLPLEVVVVDNDAEGSALRIVEQAVQAGAPYPIHYSMQPLKNISLTRNATVAAARGDWLAFIDDDERAPTGWLEKLTQSARRFGADGVLGPVQPVLPKNAPRWLRRGRFYHWPRMKSGTVVPTHLLRFGNVLLNANVLKPHQPLFDPAYGLTGGEDGDLLTRLVQSGARIIWCDDAKVLEPVELSRLSLKWLLLRALRGGQDFARHVLAGRHGSLSGLGRLQFFMRALLQMTIATGLALLCLPLGLHVAAHWLTKAFANLGKLSTLLGLHYREYA